MEFQCWHDSPALGVTLELDSLHAARVVGSYTYPENHKKIKSKQSKTRIAVASCCLRPSIIQN